MHSKIAELRRKAAPINYYGGNGLEVRADGRLAVKEGRTIKGYAAVWGVVDSYGTVFLRGAFAKSIQERGPDSSAKYKITLVWQHDLRDPIGRVTVLQEDDYGLYFEAEVDEIPQGDRALKQIESGTLNQFSFGFNYIWDKLEYNEKKGVVEVREVDLFELSPVTIGSNLETFAIRSPEGREAVGEALSIEIEEFIRVIPRDKQLELRQLFARHKALCSQSAEPFEVRRQTLDTVDAEPPGDGIDYEYIMNNLKF